VSKNPITLLGLPKRLNQSVEQDPIKAAIVEANAVLMVLIEGIHGGPCRCEFGRITDHVRFSFPSWRDRDIKGKALG
jgi:hypothetical protein